MPETPVENLSFEDALAELEATVQKLEEGNLLLEEAMRLYERGQALARHCGSHLDQAELRVKELTPSGDLDDFEPGL